MKLFAPVFLLLLFTLSPLGQATPAALPLQIGYIPVESIETGKQILQDLLKHKWAKSAIVVPIREQDPKNPDTKAAKASGPTHLLLVETSAALIPNVKNSVSRAYLGFKPPQVEFAPATSTTPYLGVKLIDHPAPHATAHHHVKDVEHPAHHANAHHHATRLTTGLAKTSVHLHGLNEIPIKAVIGKPFVFQVKGEHLPGYVWNLNPNSGLALSHTAYEEPADSQSARDSILALQFTAHHVGDFRFEASYVQVSNPSYNPVVKTLFIKAEAK